MDPLPAAGREYRGAAERKANPAILKQAKQFDANNVEQRIDI
jgi:hypothetical protein